MSLVAELEAVDRLRIGTAARAGSADEDARRVGLRRRVARLRRVPAGLLEIHTEVADGRFRIDGHVHVDSVEIVRKYPALTRLCGGGPSGSSRSAAGIGIDRSIGAVYMNAQRARVPQNGKQHDS